MGVFKDMFEQAKENGVSKAAIILSQENKDVVVLAKSELKGYILIRLVDNNGETDVMSAPINFLPLIIMTADGTSQNINLNQDGIDAVKAAANMPDVIDQLISEENTEAIFRKFDELDEQFE